MNAEEHARALQARIESNLDRAVYDEPLLQELSQRPTWILDFIFDGIIDNAAWGQRLNTRLRVRMIQRAVRERAAPVETETCSEINKPTWDEAVERVRKNLEGFIEENPKSAATDERE